MPTTYEIELLVGLELSNKSPTYIRKEILAKLLSSIETADVAYNCSCILIHTCFPSHACK